MKMTPHVAVTALIAAALEMKWKYEEDLRAQEVDALLKPSVLTEDTAITEEQEEEAWVQQFADAVARAGLERFITGGKNPDVRSFASLARGEPSFTLLGHDATASVAIKNWLEINTAFNDDIRAKKLFGAEDIIAKFEKYPEELQRFPD